MIVIYSLEKWVVPPIKLGLKVSMVTEITLSSLILKEITPPFLRLTEVTLSSLILNQSPNLLHCY